MQPSIENLAYLTADLPGIGGVIKQRHEDFLVEEQPLYEPCGQGEHLYLYIEKQGMATMQLVQRIAKAFRVRRTDVGYAGMKDKHAVTRQHFSVYLPGTDEARDNEAMERIDSDNVKLLWAQRHENKLRRGHHGGNRFVIYIRDVSPTAVINASRILERLAVDGTPNYLGEQRFGYRMHNHDLGRLLLCGNWQAFLDVMLGEPRESDYESTRLARAAYDRGDFAGALEHWPKHMRADRQALDALRQGKTLQNVVRTVDKTHRDYLISAWQSAVFNYVLHQRLEDGTYSRLLEGDLAWKHDNRSVFVVDGPTAELENGPGGRVGTCEVSPTGPMWGVDMIRAAGAVGELEFAAMRLFGLDEAQLVGGPLGGARGVRRPLRQFIKDPDVSGGVDEHGSYVRMSFELGRGSFATVVLREVMKSAGHSSDEGESGESGDSGDSGDSGGNE